jgi:CubicO group peptidase (beta-lactamase class C family)
MTTIHGTADPGFGGVADAFARNFAELGEVGAAVCVYQHGTKVVDLWGGVADPITGRPFTEEAIVMVASTTKGATAICANLLAQRGLLDIDAPVVTYWPEFADKGKDTIPVRWLLCHKAGLPTYEQPLTLLDFVAWDPVVESLAAQEPLWEPGTAYGYHALTYGHLVGEVIRRITGKSVGTFLAEEVVKPLGIEFWIGLPNNQSYDERYSEMIAADPPTDPDQLAHMARIGRESIMARSGRGAMMPSFGADEDARRLFRSCELPAGNGITNARSLARMYAATIGEVDGVRLLDEATMEAARTNQVEGIDLVLLDELRRGLGFMLESERVPMLGRGSFGHPGAGGSLGCADPESGLAFGYVMNKMSPGLAGDHSRPTNLVLAAKDSVTRPSRRTT